MDHDEKVGFRRNELEKAQRTFPKESTDVQVAELNYERALREAVCQGSPTISGSDLSLTESISVRVAFYCDRLNVTAVFYSGEERVGRPQVFSRTEAVEVGNRVTDTGIYEKFPISGVSTSALKTFGIRLKEYGENCR